MQFILEHALAQAIGVLHIEFVDLTLLTSDCQDSRLAHRMTHWVFISRESPLSNFLKINFDGNVLGSKGGTGFIIRDPNARFVAVRNSHLFRPSVFGGRAACCWAGIVYARLILHAIIW